MFIVYSDQMNRYLLHISYIGTYFKSFTKCSAGGVEITPTTVGVIEQALRLLKPKNPIKVETLSRTDAGVHALNSAVLVNLERKNGKLYDTMYVSAILNNHLSETKHNVRINGVELVPNSFNAHGRIVKSRTYIYRLAIIKPNMDVEIPLEEQNRCLFLYSEDFNVERAKNAAKMLEGTHDFRSFMTVNNLAHERPSYAIRKINSISIDRDYRSALLTLPAYSDHIDYWNITINAKSFLYRQVRRIVGTLIAIAKNRITERDVYEMLTIPSRHSLCRQILVCPPNGLYLANIEFMENSKVFNSDSIAEIDQPKS